MAERTDSQLHHSISYQFTTTTNDDQSGSNGQARGSSATEGESPLEPKKCWICFGDSNEDIPGSTSPWRTPCPCALTAHEACLLDWIADLEAPPSNSSQARARKDKIQCPQCKTEIKVARPWSPIVAGVRAVERVASGLVLPGVASILVGGVFSACFVHGAVSVFLVLGPEEWERLVVAHDGNMRSGFRLMLSLPMVPLVLVLSRTNLADGIIPMLPFLFFAPQVSARMNWQTLAADTDGGASFRGRLLPSGQHSSALWPPSPTAAFALLPFIRAVYNAGYASLFAAKEREWVRAVQREPRPGETNNPDENDRPAAQHGDMEIQAEIIFNNDGDVEDQDPAEVQAALDQAIEQAVEEVQAEAEEEAEADEAAAEEAGAQQVAGRNGGNGRAQRPIRDEAQGAGRRQGQGGRAGQRNQRQQPNINHQNHGLTVSASRIADIVLGALCFPAIASLMGEALRFSLPVRLTTTIAPTSSSRRPGLLQTRWGRSIVGGCLFVVMKDALLLYTKYRLAQDHRKRRVVDYRGSSVRSSNGKADR